MGNCIGTPPPPPGASRAARCLAVPGGRSFYVWQEWHAENSRLLGKLRAAAQAMANLPVKRGLNQWQCVCEEEREAKRKLLEACRNIVNSQVRKAYSQWADICAAVNAKKEKLRAAIALLSPEGRAKKAVMLKLVWIRKRKLAMQKALAGFRLAGPRKALHHMLEQVHAMQKLRRGGAAIRNRKARAAYNAWAEAALAGAERKRKMEAALKRMSPEGRMLMAGFGAWLELLYELQGLRRAASGFINGSCKRAMTAWIEATFAAFHISSGMEGHMHYLMRKALHRWTGRAGLRRGLRRQLFASALKGRDVMRLMQMVDEADTDDLCNAILAKDAEGCSPLLWAAKKGNLDVVELLITCGARCAEELGDESLLNQLLDSSDADGNTPLHWAARKNQRDVAASLLEGGANVDSQNKEGATPLHWAGRKNHTDLLRLLLDGNASMSIQNKWGSTPLEQATSFDQKDAVNMLQAEVQRTSKPKKSAKPQAAWGEGPGAAAMRIPPKLREDQAARKAAAEKRRQEALKIRDNLDDQKAKDLELRRRRGACEMRLKDAMELVEGPISKTASRSPPAPPKLKNIKALSEAIKEATELGVINTLVQQAEAKLSDAERRQEAAREAKAANGEAVASQDAKKVKKAKKPGDKNPNAEMEKMQKKMQKKLNR